ncbi:hypothetical protein VB774_13055 [Pseudanabaena galeata UHCC 0370]|uniref:Uncharacterized protein n=1 Tax=Pseudanabaena galeata UHCC 0370 TaxID=3110310 RepID=A0ABU5TJW5_9CYAN|nr:hypothetical protein [Pseudanabaena galeata]MEA5478550.1 hypothetical protein [Pseudanabaena galeata UHCC 0370]
MNTFFHTLTYSMLLISVLPLAIQAQTTDQQGNYYSNEAPIKSANYRAAGSLWQVTVANGLNCRRSASLRSPIVRTYLKNAVLEVEVYRGGSDEVLVNPLDENGRPWMPVRGRNIEDICYVRANSLYIQPIVK